MNPPPSWNIMVNGTMEKVKKKYYPRNYLPHSYLPVDAVDFDSHALRETGREL
jgi:hypothetical protein